MNPNDSELIIQAEHTIANAHLTMEIATIDVLLHKDYAIAQPDGKMEIKE